MTHDIPGYMPDHELAVLQRFAKDKRVLEIGCWKGRSTVGMADVAEQVWTVDHFKGDNYAGKGYTLPEFVQYLDIVGLRQKVVAIVGDFYKVVPHLHLAKFDTILYDACHDYEPTRDFLDMVRPKIRPGTTILVHDYAEGYPQVMRAVQEFAEKHSFSLGREHTIGIIQA